MGGKILLAVALIAAVPFVASCAGSGRGHISAQTEAGHIPVVGRGHGGKLKSAGWWAAWERLPFSSIPWSALTQLIMFSDETATSAPFLNTSRDDRDDAAAARPACSPARRHGDLEHRRGRRPGLEHRVPPPEPQHVH